MTTEQADPVRDARAIIDRAKELRPALKDEKAALLKRIEEIDAIQAELGDVAKPKVGRPRGARTKKGANDASLAVGS